MTNDSHEPQKSRDVCKDAQSRAVDPLDALEAKWDAEPADEVAWEKRARRALALARRWRGIAGEWEESARKEASRGR